LNQLDTQLLKIASNNPQASITIKSQSMPTTLSQTTLLASLSSIFISIAFAFIPASFIHWSVTETELKTKHLQQISGVSALSYHVSNFVFDFLQYLAPMILCCIAIAIFDIEQLLAENFSATFVILNYNI
jgi:ATP-binding cassette, subfamily A (ABC1), member 3